MRRQHHHQGSETPPDNHHHGVALFSSSSFSPSSFSSSHHQRNTNARMTSILRITRSTFIKPVVRWILTTCSLLVFVHVALVSSSYDYYSTILFLEQFNQSRLVRKEELIIWKRELFARLDRIRQVCGDLCNMNDQESIRRYQININLRPSVNNSSSSTMMTMIKDGGRMTTTIPILRVPNVNCDGIIGNVDIDASDWTFPTSIPDELLPYFTVGGLIPYDPLFHFRHPYQGGNAMTVKWTRHMLELQKEKAMIGSDADADNEENSDNNSNNKNNNNNNNNSKNNKNNNNNSILLPRLKGTYGVLATRMVRDKLRRLQLFNKSVLVIGSEKPWIEAICLGLGAAHVTTLEYGRIVTNHPQVTTLTPSEFRHRYHNHTLGTFDVVVSHSSLEHSGLGRYGDGLNPWGDILALARAWCVTKDGGGLYLGLPTGQDRIVFNAHRVYGKVRWPLITTNWEPILLEYEHDDDNMDPSNKRHEFEEYTDGMNATNGGMGFLFRKIT